MTALLWGVLAVVLKYCLLYVSVSTVISFRFAFSALALFIYFMFNNRGSLRILKGPPGWLIVAAVLLSVNYWGFSEGLRLTSAGNAQVLIQLSQLTFALIGVLYFKESLSRVQFLGFALAGLGFLLFYRDQLSHLLAGASHGAGDSESAARFHWGNLLLVVAAVSWAFWAAIQKAYLSHWRPQEMNLLVWGIGALLFLPAADPGELVGLSSWAWIALIFTGLNTLVAYGLLAEALQYLPANQVGMIITLNPLVTLFVLRIMSSFDVDWIRSESVTALGYVGAACMLGGVALVVRKRA